MATREKPPLSEREACVRRRHRAYRERSDWPTPEKFPRREVAELPPESRGSDIEPHPKHLLTGRLTWPGGDTE